MVLHQHTTCDAGLFSFLPKNGGMEGWVRLIHQSHDHASRSSHRHLSQKMFETTLSFSPLAVSLIYFNNPTKFANLFINCACGRVHVFLLSLFQRLTPAKSNHLGTSSFTFYLCLFVCRWAMDAENSDDGFAFHEPLVQHQKQDKLYDDVEEAGCGHQMSTSFCMTCFNGLNALSGTLSQPAFFFSSGSRSLLHLTHL